MLRRVWSKLSAIRVTKKDVAVASVLGLLLFISTAMTFFGMNFWLWSFAKGINRSYTCIFIPAVGWSCLFTFTAILLCTYQYCRGIREAVFFWVCRKGILLLFLIGLFDSLAGLCGMYAAVHVPLLVQSTLMATGPVWTFIMARLLYRESQPPFSPLLLLVFTFIACGVGISLVTQVRHSKNDRYLSPPWLVIFMAATAFSPLYNVLQGRFLKEFEEQCSPFRCKVIMLSVETSIQLVLTTLYLPIDAAPFFGTSDSIEEAWEMFIKSIKCIGTCKNNAVYMLVFVLGFWIRRFVLAYFNGYSPTLAAIASQLTHPINLFIMFLFPQLNIYGAPSVWYYTFFCFLSFLASTLIYIVYHLYFTQVYSIGREGSGDFESVLDVDRSDESQTVCDNDCLKNIKEDNK